MLTVDDKRRNVERSQAVDPVWAAQRCLELPHAAAGHERPRVKCGEERPELVDGKPLGVGSQLASGDIGFDLLLHRRL